MKARAEEQQQIKVKPILLLDDIFDRIDEERINKFVEMVKNKEFNQIFITDTHKERIESIFKLPAIDFFPRKDAILNIGKFIFDPNNQLLTISNETLKLSFRETELLQYLFLSNHSIIQRKDLMNHIWGNDSFFNSRNLDVYITKLRGYLKNDPSIQIITIKGVGYRFVIGGKQL